MAVLNYALTTRQNVKDLLGITDDTKDALIDMLVDAVTDFIEGYCGGRRFLATNYTEVKDTYNSDKLFLSQRPVTAITSVKYRSGLPSSPTWVDYNANSYLTYLGAGFLRFFTKFTAFPQAFQVVYTAGYLIDWANVSDATLHTLPHDLTQVATELVGQKYNARLSQGVYSESTEGQSITYASDRYALNDDHKSVLNKYKISRVAP